jgi:MFS family permease
MISLYNMALMALLSMIPFYLASAHDFTLETIGITFSALLIIGALAQPWVGKISDIVGRRPVLIIGNLTAGVACIMLAFQPTFWIMIIAMAFAIAAADSIRAVILAATVDHTDHSEGTTLGLAFVFLEGVSAFGAVLAGIAAGYSWSHMFAFAAFLSLGASALACVTAFER